MARPYLFVLDFLRIPFRRNKFSFFAYRIRIMHNCWLELLARAKKRWMERDFQVLEARIMREVGNKVSGWREHRGEDAGFEIGVEFRLVRSA